MCNYEEIKEFELKEFELKEFFKTQKMFLHALSEVKNNSMKVLKMREENFEDSELEYLELLYVNFYNVMRLAYQNGNFPHNDGIVNYEFLNNIMFDMASFMNFKLNSYLSMYEKIQGDYNNE